MKIEIEVSEDAIRRTEWINQRVLLTDEEKEYITFQIKEAVLSAVQQINDIKIKINN